MLIPVLSESLIVLREHCAKTGVDDAKHYGVGHGLDNRRLTGGEGEEDTWGEEDEENNGDDDIEIHVCSKALKNISSQKHIQLMVKNFHTLALRAMQTNQQIAAHLIRVQSGFLRAQNIEQAQETLDTLQEMLRDMQSALNAPPNNSQHRQSNYVPLK